MRRAFGFIEWLLVVITIGFILFACFASELVVATKLAFGWVMVLWRLPSETTVDWPNTAVAAACLVLLFAGSHVLLRWLHRHRSAGAAAGTWRCRWTAAVVGVVLMTFLAGIAAVGATYQMIWLARFDGQWFTKIKAGPDLQSTNNLKQLGLAAHNFHEDRKRLPPGGTFDRHGTGLHGWQAYLLPYVEQEALFNQIDFKRPWNDPQNIAVTRTRVAVFMHPSIGNTTPAAEPAPSHYAANVHVLGVTPLTFGQIADGTSYTLLMGEVAANFSPWGRPGNWRDPSVGLNASPDGFGRPRGQFVIFVFCDGSVQRVRDDVSPAVLMALSTPTGGEKFVWPE